MKKLLPLFPMLLLLLLSSCEKEFIQPVPGNDPEAVFEYFWTSYQEHYANFEVRGVDWQAQYDLYRPQVSANTTDDELFEIFKQMLLPLKDGHIKLIKPGEQVYTPDKYYRERFEDELFDLDLIKNQYMNGDFLINGYDFNTYGWLPNNIGYVWTKWSSVNWEDMDEVLDYFANADGLIFDLRHNGGGDFSEIYSKFGRFTKEERYVFRAKTKNGPGPDDYTEWHDWSIYPEGDYFDKPIVLLTDRYTISAGERAAMAFMALPNVTSVGDTTSGAISTMLLRELPNGWNYSLVPQKIEFLNGIACEGIGLVPDHVIENDPVEMQNGQDRVLEYAMGLF